MQKILVKFTILLLFFSFFPLQSFANDESLKIYQFGNMGCPHCRDEKTFLGKMEEKYSNLEIVYYDAWGDDSDLMQKVATELGLEVHGVPFLVIGSDFLLGFNNETTSGAKIEEMISSCLGQTCQDVVNQLVNPQEISAEVKFEKTTIKNKNLYKKLRGRIILKVEDLGKAYYVYPESEEAYYLGRPADAFQVMRDLGLGISNADFESFSGVAPERLAGKILLKVEAKGEAYYVNPADLKIHYLGRPADAFEIMRKLGMGISNFDFDSLE